MDKPGTFSSIIMRFLLLILLIVAGMLAGSGLALLIAGVSGLDTGILHNAALLDSAESRNVFRSFMMINHLTTFIIPAIVFGTLVYRNRVYSLLGFEHGLTLPVSLAGIGLMLVIFPFVIWTYSINKMLSLPAWMMQLEERAAELTQAMVVMHSPSELAFSLLVIAVIPSLGEELIFRGIIQRNLGMVMNRHVAVWLGAIIFSAVHMQFHGFVPRMVLGLALGYMFLYSGNLWLPIIGHFVNNGFQVVMHYAFLREMSSIDMEAEPGMPFMYAMLSLMAGLLLLWYMAVSNADRHLPPLKPKNTTDVQAGMGEDLHGNH